MNITEKANMLYDYCNSCKDCYWCKLYNIKFDHCEFDEYTEEDLNKAYAIVFDSQPQVITIAKEDLLNFFFRENESLKNDEYFIKEVELLYAEFS